MAAHLYTHSDYSLLESVCRVESLVERAAKSGIKYLALTDRGTTAGHAELEYYAKREGVNPIFGVELDSQDLGQVVLLAMTVEGYQNLLYLTSQPGPLRKEGLLGLSRGLAILVSPDLQEPDHAWLENEFGCDYYIRFELGQSYQPFGVFPEHKFVLCQDVRYLETKSLLTLEVLGKIKGKGISPPEYPLLSWEELSRRFQGPSLVLKTTMDLAQRCSSVRLPRAQILPPHPAGESIDDAVWRGAKERFGSISEAVSERLHHELGIIKDLGYEDYFLIVADIVRFAKGAGIPIGPGRGSAASSLVAHVLGITEVNSLSWGLLFERFLNAERNKRPDIDLDFCYERRGEVLAYLVERFGRDHVAQIGTYGTFGAKGAAQEVRRALGKDKPAVAEEMQGLKRHRSTHAAGVIITAGPIQAISAVYLDRDIPVTHLDMYALEELGVLKIDLLGLKTLTLLRQVEELVKKGDGSFSLQNIPSQDEATLAQLGTGKSLGIFQLESEFYQDLLTRLRPRSFQDLVALLALGRPGPLGMFPEYVARRDNPKKICYSHPALAEILSETYGLILYQEQVMLIANQVAGLSLGEADLLRSALSKSNSQDTEVWQGRFTSGARAKSGLSASEADKLFAMIAQFSGYAFNKAHSVSYARITWQAAYLKTHYPAEFFLTLLSKGSTGKEFQMILNDARRLGLKVLPPSVLHSETMATLEHGQLRLGLLTNRHLTPRAANAIIQERGKWSSLRQFRQTTRLDEASLERLVLCGALDDLGSRNKHLQELGLASKGGLELLRLERDLLGVYASNHPCTPFAPLIQQLRGDLPVVAGEILETKLGGSQWQGKLDTPQGPLPFRGPRERFGSFKLAVGGRIALFGYPEVEWAFPLGPTLLITPTPHNLEAIKLVLEGQRGSKPAILLLGGAYHLLPSQFWVSGVQEMEKRLQEKQIVYTWLDPWKENV